MRIQEITWIPLWNIHGLYLYTANNRMAFLHFRILFLHERSLFGRLTANTKIPQSYLLIRGETVGFFMDS